jgi:hypothetical protein
VFGVFCLFLLNSNAALSQAKAIHAARLQQATWYRMRTP